MDTAAGTPSQPGQAIQRRHNTKTVPGCLSLCTAHPHPSSHSLRQPPVRQVLRSKHRFLGYSYGLYYLRWPGSEFCALLWFSSHNPVFLLLTLRSKISSAVYQHKLNVLRVATRGSLNTLIYAALLNGHSDAYETGSAVSLMGTDAESLSQAPGDLHELWSYALEAIVGTVMLASQVGWLCLVPLLFICCRV